jgi:hypothetical protein
MGWVREQSTETQEVESTRSTGRNAHTNGTIDPESGEVAIHTLGQWASKTLDVERSSSVAPGPCLSLEDRRNHDRKRRGETRTGIRAS